MSSVGIDLVDDDSTVFVISDFGEGLIMEILLNDIVSVSMMFDDTMSDIRLSDIGVAVDVDSRDSILIDNGVVLSYWVCGDVRLSEVMLDIIEGCSD